MKSWYEKIVAAHRAVTDQVSHISRIRSERYFVWQEDGGNYLLADGGHVEKTVTGTTDLFTRREFDPWKEQFEQALDAAGICWELLSIQQERDTGFYHYEWAWEV